MPLRRSAKRRLQPGSQTVATIQEQRVRRRRFARLRLQVSLWASTTYYVPVLLLVPQERLRFARSQRLQEPSTPRRRPRPCPKRLEGHGGAARPHAARASRRSHRPGGPAFFLRTRWMCVDTGYGDTIGSITKCGAWYV